MLLSGRHIALLLVVTILATSVASTLSQNNSIKINHHDHISTHHTLLNSTCSATFYPELCVSAISELPAETAQLISYSVMLRPFSKTATSTLAYPGQRNMVTAQAQSEHRHSDPEMQDWWY
ncbi:hypothetical protein Q3G72_033937 [Acer saccharum]|nr:hypothetical protein Q3G72_033937 [Acer saccharum]